MKQHRAALVTIGTAAIIIVAGGLAFAAADHISPGLGLYFAITTATTAGYGDVIPRSTAGHWIAVILMLTAVPLVAATFSLVTATLTASQVKWHMNRTEERLKQHVDERLQHHLGRSGE